MRNALLATFVAASLVGVARLEAQNITSQTIDTIIVEGNARIDDNLIIATTGISTGVLVSYLDIQLAVTRLYASGEFRDVEFLQGNVGGERALLVRVEEQPLLTAWGVQGVERLTGRAVRGRVKLTSGRAYSPSLAEQSRASIDSLYKQEGYYAAEIQILSQPAPDGRTTQVVFDIIEGRRVAISEIIVEGNERVSDAEVASAMSTGVEGFWWFKRGEYDEDKLEIDVRENIPSFYASRGFVDATVVRDTLIVNEDTGKGTLIVTVNEGPQYRVGSFEVVGNRQYSTESIEQFYPFQSQATGFFGLGGEHAGPPLFNQADWDEATQDLSNLYFNTGYIYARIDPIVTRRVD
ncbi:MAG: POTRA domain-containing protein, partial [Gemmatimonadales bacterium]